MKARILAAIAAVVLAVLGTMVLANYVSAADQRALRGAESVQVYVVAAPIASGTAADKLLPLITLQSLPAKAVAIGAVTDLAQLAGRVSTVDLVPGEQLIEGRFADPASIKAKNAETGSVPLPPGMQEVTIQLDPQRVVGGQLTAGDTVGVLFSFGGGSIGASTNAAAEPVTHMSMQKVLVTAVQGVAAKPTPATGGPDQSGSAPAAIPAGAVLVTLARTAPDVEKLVYAAENGKIWLSKEPSSASETGTRELTRDGIFK